MKQHFLIKNCNEVMLTTLEQLRTINVAIETLRSEDGPNIVFNASLPMDLKNRLTSGVLTTLKEGRDTLYDSYRSLCKTSGLDPKLESPEDLESKVEKLRVISELKSIVYSNAHLEESSIRQITFGQINQFKVDLSEAAGRLVYSEIVGICRVRLTIAVDNFFTDYGSGPISSPKTIGDLIKEQMQGDRNLLSQP